MKKLTLIFFIALLVVNTSFAQDKPSKGSWSTEIQFNPFDQDGETFNLDGLKVRYFLTDKDAIRLRVNFNRTHANVTDKYSDDLPGDPTDYYMMLYDKECKTSRGQFSISLGYERHFDFAKRFDFYAGGSIGVGKSFASTNINHLTNYSHSSGSISSVEKVYETVNIEVKNATLDYYDGMDIPNMMIRLIDRASFEVNFDAFVGLDFYVYKGLYIGTELGIRCSSYKTKKAKLNGNIERKVVVHNREEVEQTIIDEETTKQRHAINFSTYIEPVLRLGFTF